MEPREKFLVFVPVTKGRYEIRIVETEKRAKRYAAMYHSAIDVGPMNEAGEQSLKGHNLVRPCNAVDVLTPSEFFFNLFGRES